MPTDTAPGIGHNQPPAPTPEELKAELDSRYARLAGRVMALVDATDRLPSRVEDEQTASKLGDFVGQCRAAAKAIGDAHKVEKEPHFRAGQAVDRWFRDLRTMVEGVVDTTTKLLQPFIDQQLAEEKRRAREAEAERVAALRLQLEAEAAERKELEAIAAAEEAERAAEAQRVAAAAREEAKRLEAQTNGATPEQVQAARTTAMEASQAAEEARLAADLAAKQAAAPAGPVHVEPEELDPRVRIPGANGRVLGKSQWTWEFIDPAKVDYSKISRFIPPDALASAIDAAVKAGLRDCRGVRIFETTKVIV
jgi:hypothetical protein